MAKPTSKVLYQQQLPFAKAIDRKRVAFCSANQHVTVSKRRRPGEVWIENSLCPSGISNPANNCWANSVLQCMLNSSLFMEVISEQILSHPASCSINCNHSGKPNPYILSFSLLGTCTYTYTRQHLCYSSDKKNGTFL